MDEYTDGIIESEDPTGAAIVWGALVAAIFLVIIFVVFLS